MCVEINIELAVAGLLGEIVVIKQKENRKKEFTLSSINGTKVTSETVYNYCNWLHYANCGPVLRKFDNASLYNFFKDNSSFFEKKSGNVFEIRLDSRVIEMSKNTSDIVDGFKKILINEFNPDMNYPKRFIKFLKLS